jgi:hypothetical protein
MASPSASFRQSCRARQAGAERKCAAADLYLWAVSMDDFQEVLGTLSGKDAQNLSQPVIARLAVTCTGYEPIQAIGNRTSLALAGPAQSGR